MPTSKLTDTAVRALPLPSSGQVTHWDQSLPGFGLRIAPGGSRAWVVMYRRAGRVQRVTLGRYPLLGVADAREIARGVLASVVKGEDPAGERRGDRSAKTFGEVAELYLERHAKARKRSWQEDERILNADVLPKWKNRRAKDITAPDVRELLDAIVERGAPIQANRTFALVRKMFNWAAAPDREFVPQPHNPCRGIEPPAAEQQRDRVLSESELRTLWRALDREDAATAAIFKLQLLTAQRGGEVQSMKWDDVDLESAWWTIPSERAKNGRSHRVPLAPAAIALLQALPQDAARADFVYPALRADAAMEFRANVYSSVRRLRTATGIAFTPHDLRRTAASYMTGSGVPRLVVSKILNHADSGVTAVYDRHSYDREKREALSLWAERLNLIVAE